MFYNKFLFGTHKRVPTVLGGVKQENVCVAFDDGDGMFLADAESYGADKLWCLFKPIPIELSTRTTTRRR